MSRTTKAQQVRQFLLGPEKLSAEEIARKVGTTTQNVYNIRSKLAGSATGKKAGLTTQRKPPAPPRREEEAPLTSEAEPTRETAAPTHSAGVSYVVVELTAPQAPVRSMEPAEEWQHDCGFKGSGKPPAACPKCGGA